MTLLSEQGLRHLATLNQKAMLADTLDKAGVEVLTKRNFAAE
ncbi:MAG: hypothetical protein ABL889_18275 [Terricaulis sp.]